jgi:hypothetical protein
MLTSKLIVMQCGSSLDVILWGVSLFLRMNCQLLREGCRCSGPL